MRPLKVLNLNWVSLFLKTVITLTSSPSTPLHPLTMAATSPPTLTPFVDSVASSVELPHSDDDDTLVVLRGSSPRAPAGKRRNPNKRTALHALMRAASAAPEIVKKLHEDRLEVAMRATMKAKFNRKVVLRQVIPVFEAAAAKGDQQAAIELAKYKAEDASLGEVKKVPARSITKHHRRLLQIHTCGPLLKAIVGCLDAVDSFITSSDKNEADLKRIERQLRAAANIAKADTANYVTQGNLPPREPDE